MVSPESPRMKIGVGFWRLLHDIFTRKPVKADSDHQVTRLPVYTTSRINVCAPLAFLRQHVYNENPRFD